MFPQSKKVVGLALMSLLSTCGSSPTSPEDPKEQWVLAETQRVAGLLREKVEARITSESFYTTSPDGTICLAAGQYWKGKILYWRPVILEQDFTYGTSIAIHEVCHSKSLRHDELFFACLNLIENGSR